MAYKPSLAKELSIVPDFSRTNLAKFKAIAKIYYTRMSAFYPVKEVIEILFSKFQESDFMVASEQAIDTWEKFENFIVLLGVGNKSPTAIIQEIMLLRQFSNESLIDYLHRVERMAAEYKLSLQISNETFIFTDMAFSTFVCKMSFKGLKTIYRAKLSDQESTFSMEKFRTFCTTPSSELFTETNKKSFYEEN